VRSLCSVWEHVKHEANRANQASEENELEEVGGGRGGVVTEFTTVKRKKHSKANRLLSNSQVEIKKPNVEVSNQYQILDIPNEINEKHSIKMLGTVLPDGLNRVEDEEWEEIEMAIDSGATETVVGEDMLTSVDTVEGEAFRRGVKYEVASGTLIPNLGEKRFTAVGEGGEVRRMKAQVCSVNKALLSVKRVLQAGNRVVFDTRGSYIEDEVTGERMKLHEVNGMYMLKLWVRRTEGF